MNTKALITATQLVCAFVFAYAKSRFSHDAAHMRRVVRKPEFAYTTNKDEDQTVHACSLIGTFVFHCMDYIKPSVVLYEISGF